MKVAKLPPWAPAAIILTGFAATGGCGGPGVAPDAPAPQAFRLTLAMNSDDGRHTYFELSRDGVLSYAGGRDAVTRAARPIRTLSDAEREGVWRIIAQEQLDQARGRLFPEGGVIYEFSLNAGGLAARTVTAAEADAPGLRRLHDRLFELQAKGRYNVLGIP